jgi:hypothetical protein
MASAAHQFVATAANKDNRYYTSKGPMDDVFCFCCPFLLFSINIIILFFSKNLK